MLDKLSIIKSFYRNFQSTGTIFPSSRYLAEQLCLPLKHKQENLNILEVGAGTGPISAVIIENLKDQDRLTLSELSPEFCEILKNSLDKNLTYQNKKERIKIVCAPIQELETEQKFDVIICSLPFLNFSKELTDSIFKKLHDLAKEHTEITYFSYIGGRTLRYYIPSSQQVSARENLKYLENNPYFDFKSQKSIYCNVFPARVWHGQKK